MNCSSNNEAEILVTKTIVSKRNGVSFRTKIRDKITDIDNSKYLLLMSNASSKHKKTRSNEEPDDLKQLRRFISESLGNGKYIFLTVTFKNKIQTVKGSLKTIEQNDVLRTAVYLKNKIGCVFGGKRKRIDFIPCMQTNSNNNWHLHIVFGGFKNPETFEALKANTFEKLQKILGGICSDHELLHNQRDVQISYNNNDLIGYNTRIGVESWIPEATLLKSKKVFPFSGHLI
jgi:hypothetical protein